MTAAVKYLDTAVVKNKRVLLRADFDVSLNPDQTIANDVRIQSNLPTIRYLLKNKNRLICVAKLGRPKGRDPKLSLIVVAKRLQEYLPDYRVILVDDFLNPDQSVFNKQTEKQILVLENIRFYPEEKKNDQGFAKKLAALADVFVSDGFAVAHRVEASVVGVTQYLPSYCGLLLKKEIEMISKAIKNPKRPLVAIIGGAKVSTKIGLITKLAQLADQLLIGGALANTFICAQGYNIGTSFCEYDKVSLARKLLKQIAKTHTQLLLPTDALVAKDQNSIETTVVKVEEIPPGTAVFDIGPATQAFFGAAIAKAKTIIWNGPVGYFENAPFRRGTDFLYYSIAQNQQATSIVGGGDTLSAISKKEYLDQITHISTGGGAMLELIEKGTLPGIEALKR